MKTTIAAVLIVAAFATAAFARKNDEWFQIIITEVNPMKVGTATEGHRFGAKKYVDVVGHEFSVQANGRRYVLSSRSDMIEPGKYEAEYTDKNRALKVRADGRREIILKIETVVPEPQVAQQKDFQSVENMLAPKSSSIAPVAPKRCIEFLTLRDGSTSCLHWTEN